MSWTPVLITAGILFVGGLAWAIYAQGKRGQTMDDLTPSNLLGGLIGLAAIAFFVALFLWGVIDAWFLGGGIPFEENYRR